MEHALEDQVAKRIWTSVIAIIFLSWQVVAQAHPDHEPHTHQGDFVLSMPAFAIAIFVMAALAVGYWLAKQRD